VQVLGVESFISLVEPGSLTDAEPGGKLLLIQPQSAYARTLLGVRNYSVASMISDDEREIAKGRIPLWLDLDDLRLVACEYSRLPNDAPEEIVRLWMRVAARAHAALQKSGHGSTPFRPQGGIDPAQ
jgi:hypothetical protein